MRKFAIAVVIILSILMYFSTCLAARKALLIGINDYRALPSSSRKGTSDLRGPVNDVTAIRRALISYYGFTEEDIRVLLNDRATRQDIRTAFDKWLVNGTRPGDTVLLYFSGHGSTVPDYNGDEEDGFDEVLCPYDMVPQGGYNIILDDDLALWLARLNGRRVVVRINDRGPWVKGRIIGADGRARKIIEETTGANVSVYGHTVSIIGKVREVEIAREAILRLIEGSEHGSVYRYLFRMRRELKKVVGVQVLGSGISLSWGEKRADLVELLKTLEDYGVVLAFDEVQYLRGPIGREFAEILAYLYDHSDLRIVLSGSEVGLLYDFLGVENPRAPLYGRYFREIRLEKFDYFKSRDFLVKGFEQVGLRVKREVVDYACEKLDGIVGWLVYFGLKCLELEPSENVVEEVLEEACKLSLDEFEKFLEKHKPGEKRIFEVARAIATGKRTWSEIKKHLESVERRTIPDGSLNRILKTLIKASFVEKVVEGRNVCYRVADPVLEHALSFRS